MHQDGADFLQASLLHIVAGSSQLMAAALEVLLFEDDNLEWGRERLLKGSAGLWGRPGEKLLFAGEVRLWGGGLRKDHPVMSDNSRTLVATAGLDVVGQQDSFCCTLPRPALPGPERAHRD